MEGSIFFGKKRVQMIVFLLIVCFCSSCGKDSYGYKPEKDWYVPERIYKTAVMKEDSFKDDMEYIGAENSILYHVPLEEIAERIEYIYTYEHMLSEMPRDYGKLGALPEGSVRLSVYTAEGNKILFLPEGRGNKVVLINGESCELYWEEEKEQYWFYCIDDFTTQEGGIPVSSVGYGSENLTGNPCGKRKLWGL